MQTRRTCDSNPLQPRLLRSKALGLGEGTAKASLADGRDPVIALRQFLLL